MDKGLKDRIGRGLQEEADNVSKNEEEKDVKLTKLNDILHLVQILDHFEELEPVIAEHMNRTAQKGKFMADR